MSSRILFYINLFFLDGEDNSFYGIKSIRYKIIYILEPAFLILVIILSILAQVETLKSIQYHFLIFLYLTQFIFIIFSLGIYKTDNLNRSFSLFLLMIFTLVLLLHLKGSVIYTWFFCAILLSSLIFRIKRTAIVAFSLYLSLIFREKELFILLFQNPLNINVWTSIIFFTIFSSFITGCIISIIVYFLEQNCSNVEKLKVRLDRKNSKLQDELLAKNRIKTALEGNELKFRTIVEYGFDGLTIVDKEGNNKFVSNSTEKITGYSPEEFKEGAISIDKIHPEDTQRVIENFRSIAENRLEHSTIYYRYMHKDGEWRNLEVSVTNLLDHPGIEGILFVYRDVTKHTRAEQRARYFEYYDQLTDLPNQNMFSEKISEEIERSSARSRSFAVMCLGINRFKDVNGEYGTTFGDMVLKQIGSRLKNHFRGDDFVSRMMGDKFLILFSDMKSEDDVIEIVQKTMKSFETPFWIENRDITISVSIGISIYPQDTVKKNELIKNSETALFLCKENRKIKYTMFNQNLNKDLIQRIQIEKEIYKAIENKSFTVYYQPKINMEGVVCGAEALIRWYSAERGMVSPQTFIPISERNRSIIEIGKIVIEKTFVDIKEWTDKGIKPVTISINVAALQFSDPHFIDSVIEMQERYKINPEYIEFEITESGIMENEKITLGIMNQLTGLGYSISIDDFGTGYSSLNKLKDYPVHTLKIDKSFIDSIPENISSCNIVKTIIDLAHNLNYQVVAEGVEEKDQVDILHSYKCDLIQGYYYYKPMPQNQFVKLISRE